MSQSNNKASDEPKPPTHRRDLPIEVPPELNFETLSGGGKIVIIWNGDQRYELRRTKANRLLLQK